MKATSVAPSNIAFIKYWGKRDEDLKIPLNGSISMNLSNLLTTTTVEFNPDFKKDLIIINDQEEGDEGSRVIKHLDRIRKLAKIKHKAKVISKNNFPTGTGLSSSASGFAALTLAASKAADLSLSEKELSILARQGSGSACRSIPDGFVEWLDGNTNETSYAVSIFPPDYWDIVDVVAVVSKDKKEISTTEGQKLAKSSPFFPARLSKIKDKIKLMKKHIQEKNFTLFGELVEQEALELHAIMLTSIPSLVYWLPGTLKVMHAVKRWRQEGLQVYFTVNTGQDIHLICQKKDAEKVVNKAKEIPDVTQTIINYPSNGAR
ncbi:MAG: diphosphomevalonate decarboxylase [Candidatus Levybacteria bacterium RIFCSPHIGHO2_02_FULL_37_13]|nr:MAG: diphosphomevalonate decarboxylase [Candidatus Levybacteria bacterium RIFCSPHIGHO2_02_FULL_37_13]OGH29816.1 MAG: diphosphomevalonate decarboxylase [Candidatus Levybacteria bacterium RIFCSPHIGHO2_12_FULL_37_9]OGH40029.1 MAG: diphosphomevalonate decarboxylase [Candidatus Levybacteria bacterium RIFCSPLOWO2_01_FULL_37_26]